MAGPLVFDARPGQGAAMHDPTIPDWSRETPARPWDPSRRLLRAIRRWQGARGPWRYWWVLQHRFWSVVTGADIPLTARIGGGLLMPHPNGIVIHPDAEIGANCLIFQQVTIGLVRASPQAPRIGAGVDIGAGAKVLGPVTLGDGAQIGANAVVLGDVPPGATAVGVPARVLPRR
jgi:serine O-acetyltransferase